MCRPIERSDIVHHLPREARVLVLFNVDSMMRTPLAEKEQWRQHHEQLLVPD
jgi:hypothetical protein